ALQRELEHAVEVRTRERPAFGRALDLDELTVRRRDDVHVRVRDRVLGVLEIEHELALHESRRHRGDMLPERRRREVAQRVRERDVAAGDRGGARAAIGLDDVAVDDHAARAQRLEIDRSAQRASPETLDLEGPSTGAALEALAAAALGRGA